MATAFKKNLLTFTSATTTQTGDVKTIHDFDGDEVAAMLTASAGVTGTLDVIVYHGISSADCVHPLFTFSQVTATPTKPERIHSDQSNTVHGPCYKAIATIGSGTYTGSVDLLLGSR